MLYKLCELFHSAQLGQVISLPCFLVPMCDGIKLNPRSVMRNSTPGLSQEYKNTDGLKRCTYGPGNASYYRCLLNIRTLNTIHLVQSVRVYISDHISCARRF